MQLLDNAIDVTACEPGGMYLLHHWFPDREERTCYVHFGGMDAVKAVFAHPGTKILTLGTAIVCGGMAKKFNT